MKPAPLPTPSAPPPAAGEAAAAEDAPLPTPSAPPPAAGEAAAAEDEPCAICFEDIAQRTALPCRCNISYCFRCWDRCLAQSFNSCGRSRCPTCRGPVRVDFDSSTGRLSFAKDDDEVADVNEHKAEAAKRLLEQARPAQMRTLQRYGESRPVLAAIVSDPREALRSLSADDLRRHTVALGGVVGAQEVVLGPERMIDAAGGAERLAAYWADCGEGKIGEEGGPLPPPCVCGGALRRIKGSVRYSEFARTLLAGYPEDHPEIENVTRQLVQHGAVQCDLCVRPVEPSSGVWTCETNDLTILHATSYDVCDLCLAQHAGMLVAPG